MTTANARLGHKLGWIGSLLPVLLLAACAVSPNFDGNPIPAAAPKAHLPLSTGWFAGKAVYYVTTDISDPVVARQKGANFAPRLALALPAEQQRPGAPEVSLDKVYAVMNSEQANVFASAPIPIGDLNRDASYSPLWQKVNVIWTPGRPARVLRSEEEILDAEEKGDVTLETTRIVLNCPIIHLGPEGGLPGVAIDR